MACTQDEPVQPLQVGDFSGDGLNDVILLSAGAVYGYQQVSFSTSQAYIGVHQAAERHIPRC